MSGKQWVAWIVIASGWVAGPSWSADWIVAPSYYTHDPSTGKRVAQYSPIGPVYVYGRPDYAESGFQHYRSSITFGGSSDNYYRVREWGRPVRPYGEWLRPFRPYSVPYPLWDSPYRGMYQFYWGWPGAVPAPHGGARPGVGRPGGVPGIGFPGHGGLPGHGAGAGHAGAGMP